MHSRARDFSIVCYWISNIGESEKLAVRRAIGFLLKVVYGVQIWQELVGNVEILKD